MVLTLTLSCVSWSSNFRKTRKSNSFIYLHRIFEGCGVRYKGDSTPFGFTYDSKVWAFPRFSSVTPLEHKAIPHGEGRQLCPSIQAMKGSSIVAGAVGKRLPYGCYKTLGVIQSHECSSTWKRWAVGKGWTFITCRATWHLVGKQPSVGKRELLHTVSFPKWQPDFISCNQGSHSDTHHKTTTRSKLGGARNGIHYGTIYFKRPRIQVKKK